MFRFNHFKDSDARQQSGSRHRVLKMAISASFLGLALFGLSSPIRAAESSVSTVSNKTGSVVQNAIQEEPSEATTSTFNAQSMLISPNTKQVELSEDMQVLILIGMLILLHGGTFWVLKQDKQKKEVYALES